METQFYILLSLKTRKSFVNYGQYFLGNDRKTTYELFHQMSGSEELTDTTLLHIDLMETIYELPVKIKSKSCTLEELGSNCKLIAKNIFRLKNLEDLT